ncbi:MAG: hypothetical protein HYZ17_16445 [Betaproteobacteria bacterium]|nr:hypothetical protein [Betaproteobacteria bacterium]
MQEQTDIPGTEHPQVRLAPETIEYLRLQMQEAVAKGIDEAMTVQRARAFWAVGLEMLQQQARISAGRFVLDGIWTVVRKGFWVAIFLGAVYALGGWTLMVSAWKVISAGK